MDRYDISMFGLVVGYAGPLLENLVVLVDDISRAKPPYEIAGLSSHDRTLFRFKLLKLLT